MKEMITVIGSINMDFVVESEILPKKGETIFGKTFSTSPGGKGANQAVAISRLGERTRMIGCLGDDNFGKELKHILQMEGVDVNHIKLTKDAPTGIANVILAEKDNHIIVVPGANYKLYNEHIHQFKQVIIDSKMVILQLEILSNTVEEVLNICEIHDVPVLLDPAPAENFKKEWLSKVDYLTPNEHECVTIFGSDIEKALANYPNKLIVTLGKEGVMYYDGQEYVMVKSYHANVKDTTGAGDAFAGALAYALVNEYSLYKAIDFANASAAISVQQLGAQAGMPRLDKVKEKMIEK